MRRTAIGVSATLIVFLILLGVRLPAAWVHAQFASGIPLNNIQGSLWQGQAGLQHQQFQVENISWQLNFWPLLLGDLSFQFELSDQNVSANGSAVIAGEDSFNINIPQATMQASNVNSLRLLPYGAAIAGEVNVKAMSVEMSEHGFVHAEGDVQWSPAYLVSPQAVSLQGYTASLQLEGNELLVHIKDQGGPLAVDGAAWLNQQFSYRYNMTMALRDQAPQAVRAGLAQMGRVDELGQVHLGGSGGLR